MTDTADTGPRHGRLWIIFGATLVPRVLHPRLLRARSVPAGAADSLPASARADGVVLMTKDDILTGQQVWQSTGGQQLGSIWGHGAYQAPDWTADWLHRESEALLAMWSVREYGMPWASLGAEPRAVLQARLARELRTNTFDAADRGRHRLARSRRRRCARWRRTTTASSAARRRCRTLREAYAMQDVVVPDAGAPRGADRLLLLDQLGRRHEPAGPGRDLHEQLAARAADRQRADERQRAVVDRQRGPAAGRRRRPGVVDGVPRGARAGEWRRPRPIRSRP